MRKHAFSGILLVIALALTAMSNQSNAEDDFSALLSDVRFRGTVPPSQLTQVAHQNDAVDSLPALTPTTPVGAGVVGDTLELPPEADLTSTPGQQNATVTSDASIGETNTAASQPIAHHDAVAQPYGDQAYADATVDGCSTNDGCDQNGCKSDNCQPYTRPQLPSSTFYQYWRSNACNVNVWYGFKNKCHGANKHTMGQCDCFKEKKGLCSGLCNKNKCGCQIVGPCVPASCDCGPPPVEWCK